MMWVKRRDNGTQGLGVYHSGLGNTKQFFKEQVPKQHEINAIYNSNCNKLQVNSKG